ncbi:MAG: C40 family peptidase [Salegentibacter sp.]
MRILRNLIFLIVFPVFLVSCGASRRSKNLAKAPEVELRTTPQIEPADDKIYKVVQNAKSFEGTPYKYGGTSKRGMDCSGLIYTSYLEEDIPLPRTSRAMSHQGKRLFLKEVTIGDLLFFQTNKNKEVINHVGMVVDVLPKEILFIHSTTSGGVIISSLSEKYWFGRFVMARRPI